MSFLGELQRRNVIKVAVAYLVAAWLLLQVTEVLVELLELPTSAGRFVIMLLALGFFPALLFAWIYELTPEGIKRESEIDRTDSITPQTGRKLNVAIIGMLVATAGYFFWESRLKDDVPAPAPTVAAESPAPAPDAVEDAPPQVQSIAVLPFVNMSNDPEQEFFSDGLSEEILNALAKIGDLRVISRTSAFAFKGKDVSIPDIAAQLDVTHVLEGSVRTAGTSVRITAQLIEVDSDSHLWSEAYNRELANVFEIQEEISKAIAAQLEVRLVDHVEAHLVAAFVEALVVGVVGGADGVEVV
ncbi:MAG: adenylyl cyclase, partial [Pseudomonadota bacterium]